MTRILVVAKQGGDLLNDTQENGVVLNQPSIVQLGVTKEYVQSIVREGNSVVITLKNGEVVVVENFFNDKNDADNSLVFPEENGGFALVNFDSAGTAVDYVGIEKLEPLLYNDGNGGLLPWLFPLAGAGAIFWWADDGGKSRVPETKDVTPPTAKATLTGITEDTGTDTKDFLTSDNTLIFNGTVTQSLAKDETVQISLDGGKTWLNTVVDHEKGTWSYDNTAKPLADGKYEILVRTIDKAGNIGPITKQQITIDTQAPDTDNALTDTKLYDDVDPITGEIKSGTSTNDARPEFSGKATPDVDHVDIYDNGKLIGKAPVKPDGTWSYTPDKDLDDGPHSFTAKPVDKAGNEGKPTPPISFEVDTIPPADNSLSNIELTDDVGAYQGPIQSGDSTDDTTPTLSGDATPDVDQVNVYDNGQLIGSTKVQPDGTWSFTPALPLPGGQHSITAKPVDKAGNEGKATSPIDFTVISSAPQAPSILDVTDNEGPVTGSLQKGQTTDDKTPVVSGTAEVGTTVIVYADGVEVGKTTTKADGTWSVELSDLGPDGEKKLTAIAEDAAGQKSTRTGEFPIILDTTAPGKPSFVAEDDVGPLQGPIKSGDTTDDTTPTLSGQGKAGETVTIYDNGQPIGKVPVDSQGNWEFTPTTPLKPGPHEITTTLTDPAGNESDKSDPLNFTVDTSTVTLTIDGVRDDQAPVIGVIGKGGITNDTTPTLFGQTQPNQVVSIKDAAGKEIATATANAAGEWSATLPAQAEGAQQYTASTELPNGSTATASIDFTIDSIKPKQPTIDSVSDDVGLVQGPIKSGDKTDDTTPTLTGTAEGNSDVAIYADDQLLGKVKADDQGNWSFTVPSPGLTEGPHALTVRQTDAAGNESDPSAPFNVVVDTTAPSSTAQLTGISQDTGVVGDFLTSDDTLIFTGQVTGPVEAGDKVQIRVDGGAWIDVTIDATGGFSHDHTATTLTEGKHKVETRVVDSAGNFTTPKEQDIEIDKTVSAADVEITSISPDTGTLGDNKTALKSGESLIVTGTLAGNLAADESVEVRVGAGAWTKVPVTNGVWTLDAGNLPEGSHTVEARVVDTAGNVGDIDTLSIAIDNTVSAADVEITGISPDTGTLDDYITALKAGESLIVSGTVDQPLEADEILQVRVGNGAWAEVSVSNGTWSFDAGNLLEGTYDIQARVIDNAGNIGDTANQSVAIANTPPTATLSISDYDDLGDSASDFYSSDVKFSINVKTEADAQVLFEEFVNGKWESLGTVKSNASGDAVYNVDYTALQLDDETRKFRATVTDKVGNKSELYLGGTDEASAQEYRFDSVAKKASLTAKTSSLNNQGTTDVVDLTYNLPESGARKVSVYSADFREDDQISEKKFLFEFTTDANGTLNLQNQLSVLDNFKVYIYETVDAAGNFVQDKDFNRIYQTATEYFDGQANYKEWYYESYSYLTEINATPIYVNPGVRFYNDAQNLAGFANRLDGIGYYDNVTVILKLSNGTEREATVNDKGYWSFSYNDVNPIGVGEYATLTLVARAMQADLQNDPAKFREDLTADDIYAQQSVDQYYPGTVSGLNGSYSYYNSPSIVIQGQAGTGKTDPLASIVEQIYTSTRDNDAIYSNGLKTTLVYEVLDSIDTNLNSGGKYLGQTGTTIGAGYGSQFDLGAFGNINSNGWIDRDGDDMISLSDASQGDFVDIDGDGIHDGLTADANRTVNDLWNHFDASKDQINIKAWIEQIALEVGKTIDSSNIGEYLSVEHVVNASQGGKVSTVLSIDRDGINGLKYDSTEFLTLEARKVDLSDLLQNNIIY